ncbi:MAG TPA: C40 family peptidase [Rectinemataceae bacterium]|nr:C40 family peptidase [Rectinemataceae bacterium]
MGRKRFRGIGSAFTFILVNLCAALFCPSPVGADAGEIPLPTLTPSRTRNSILVAAESLLGAPYVFGGKSKDGVDCSGFVFLVFWEATGHSIPRTVIEQGRWVMIIPKRELKPGDLVFFDLDPRSTSAQNGISGAGATFADAAATAASTGAADHVGIYAGDGQFMHAASAGAKTGVIRNSLFEPSWARRFLFAGRIVPASTLSGMALDWGVSASFDAEIPEGTSLEDLGFRGAGLRVAVTYPLFDNFSIGLQGRLEWDSLLDTVRLPLELLVGQNQGFSIFAGPALTLGSPSLPASEAGAARDYEAVGGWLVSAGIRWSPLLIRSGASSAGLFAELRFNRYLPLPGQAIDQAADRRAAISLGLGFRFRSAHY